MVGFEPGVSRPQRDEVLARDGAVLRRLLSALRAAGATVPAADRDRILERLRAEPAVRYAEIDRRLGLIRPRLGARLPLASAAKTPDDEGFVYQYGLRDDNDHDVDATDAWESRTKCAKVAVLDTGVDTDHKDLKANLWRNEKEKPGNGKDDDHNGYVDDDRGVDLVDKRGSGVDRQGHGTHVAGIIGAIANNGRGVSGLCWKSPIISVGFMDKEGRGYSGDAAEGIIYAVDQGAHVINASYGMTQPTDVERDAIAYAAAHDTLIVAAAGNNDQNSTSTRSTQPPTRTTTCSRSRPATRRTSWRRSRTGARRAWTWRRPATRSPPRRTAASTPYMSGTSMAAPLVAAAAAMVRKQGDGLPFARVRQLLLKYADDKKAFKGKVASGGRLNVRRAHKAAG